VLVSLVSSREKEKRAPHRTNSQLPVAAFELAVMSDQSVTTEEKDEASSTIEIATQFVKDKLHPRLEDAVARVDALEEEVADYAKILERCEKSIDNDVTGAKKGSGEDEGGDEGRETMEVDLDGTGRVYCNASISPPSKAESDMILVHVGMGFFADLTYAECSVYCVKRLKYTTGLLDHRKSEAKALAQHIEYSLEIIKKLSAMEE
jgi:prefoldin subunit 5